MRKLEPLIQENINKLVTVFRRYQKTKEPIPLRPAFGALTSDIIAEYCFGVNENYIEAPGFNVMVLETTDVLTDTMHVTVQLQWLPKFLNSLPDGIVVGMFGPGMAKVLELKRVSSERALFADYKLTTASIAFKRSKRLLNHGEITEM
tara:strand:- start:39 stop:482 length:444 start_codon:yes stop_codon:yes gene_type:complete